MIVRDPRYSLFPEVVSQSLSHLLCCSSLGRSTQRFPSAIQYIFQVMKGPARNTAVARGSVVTGSLRIVKRQLQMSILQQSSASACVKALETTSNFQSPFEPAETYALRIVNLKVVILGLFLDIIRALSMTSLSLASIPDIAYRQQSPFKGPIAGLSLFKK